jgi:hypothetical protein
MKVRIDVNNEPYGRNSLSLRNWLRAEDGLREPGEQATAAPQEGEMGSATDALVVAVSSGGAISALATSLGLWLSQLKSRPRAAVTVKITLPDETVISVRADQADDPAAVIREALSSAFRQEGGGS